MKFSCFENLEDTVGKYQCIFHSRCGVVDVGMPEQAGSGRSLVNCWLWSKLCSF